MAYTHQNRWSTFLSKKEDNKSLTKVKGYNNNNKGGLDKGEEVDKEHLFWSDLQTGMATLTSYLGSTYQSWDNGSSLFFALE